MFVDMKCWVITNQRSVAEPVLPASLCKKKTARKVFFFLCIGELKMKAGAIHGKEKGRQVQDMEIICLEQPQKQVEKWQK